ncbi:zinc-binding dehydrogenase [Dongia sp.]|uniref:zinc-binding dehydrogenase n=1 Tax=Dongia sp. TaxID=1977262 RepID=UPI0035B02DBA
MRTEAAILVKTGQPLEIWEIEVPALKPGQVLIEMQYSGACRTQILEIRGLKGEDKWVPHCLGHEGVGRVLEIGADVSRVAPDDQVVLSWLRGPGLEAGGAKYRHAGVEVNAGGVTTFQRLAVVSENRVSKVPADIAAQQAIMLGCALPTGFGCVANTGRAKAGDSVVVFGAGGIGLSAIMTAAVLGCSPVIAVDISAEKRALAQRCGASQVIDPVHQDCVAEIRVATAGRGADIAVEATGNVDVMRTALDCVRAQGGRAVIAGNAPAGAMLAVSPAQLNQGKSLLGTWGGDCEPARDFPILADLMRSGRLDVAPLLSRPYALAEINAAIDDLEAGRVGRPLIDMSLR